MARLYGINSKMRGKVGQFVYHQCLGNTVVSELPAQKDTPVRTEANMYVRLQMQNLVTFWKKASPYLQNSFTGKERNRSDFSEFLSYNLNTLGDWNIFLPKELAKKGCCVAAPYFVSQGDLETINATIDFMNSMIKSSVAIPSDLVIDEQLTIGEFTDAVLLSNDGFRDGDRLSFFYFKQTGNDLENPRVTPIVSSVVLDSKNTAGTMLSDVVSLENGFINSNGFLSVRMVDGMATWLISRSDNNGMHVSTQQLIGFSEVSGAYRRDYAFRVALTSYGGVNRNEYLFPKK